MSNIGHKFLRKLNHTSIHNTFWVSIISVRNFADIFFALLEYIDHQNQSHTMQLNCCRYPHKYAPKKIITCIPKGSLQKNIKNVDFFHTSRTPPLKCGNTFWGAKHFLQFYPENDLPTNKNLKFWSLVSGIITLEGGIERTFDNRNQSVCPFVCNANSKRQNSSILNIALWLY